MMKYKVLAFIGEAGAGKDTLARELLAADPMTHKVISCTTRDPREGEKDGEDYYFLSEPQFRADITYGYFAEFTSFNGWFYGTRFSELNKYKINIGVFNPEGIRNLMKRKDIDLRVVRVKADRTLRKERYLARDPECDKEELERRMAADDKDFSCLNFDYVTLNNNSKEDLELNIKKLERWLQMWRNTEGQK